MYVRHPTAAGTIVLRLLMPMGRWASDTCYRQPGRPCGWGGQSLCQQRGVGGGKGHALTALGLNTHFSVRMERAEDTSCERMQSERAVLSGHASHGGPPFPGYEHVYMWLGIEPQRCWLAQCVRAAWSRGLELNDCLSWSARSVSRPCLSFSYVFIRRIKGMVQQEIWVIVYSHSCHYRPICCYFLVEHKSKWSSPGRHWFCVMYNLDKIDYSCDPSDVL